VADLPGFRKAAPVPGLHGRPERLPKPDIAIIDETHTGAIVTAKWSMRQDRETQFTREYSAYSRMKLQTQDIDFFLLTNEFDVARLDNVARAQPGNVGGYLFHTIYHVNADLLRETQGNQIGPVGGWIQAGILSPQSKGRVIRTSSAMRLKNGGNSHHRWLKRSMGICSMIV